MLMNLKRSSCQSRTNIPADEDRETLNPSAESRSLKILLGMKSIAHQKSELDDQGTYIVQKASNHHLPKLSAIDKT
jgi:hypothetical protein